MSSTQPPSTHSSWSRANHLISTDKALLDISAINNTFASEWMYWTTRLPRDVLEQIIRDSFCFGLYLHNPDISTNTNTNPSPSRDTNITLIQIGFARLITDNTTFAYLTDLYVLPDFQGQGLGGWLLECVDEWLSAKPYLRWTMLRTSSLRSREAYRTRLGMVVLGDSEGGPWTMGRKGEGGRA